MAAAHGRHTPLPRGPYRLTGAACVRGAIGATRRGSLPPSSYPSGPHRRGPRRHTQQQRMTLPPPSTRRPPHPCASGVPTCGSARGDLTQRRCLSTGHPSHRGVPSQQETSYAQHIPFAQGTPRAVLLCMYSMYCTAHTLDYASRPRHTLIGQDTARSSPSPIPLAKGSGFHRAR